MYDSRDDTAIVCPHCATSIDSIRHSSARRTCPNCRAAIKKLDPLAWADVARVTNLAEAGFLTDELVGLGINARIHQIDDFNALSDRWTSLYLIQAPTEEAQEAADQISQYLENDTSNRPDGEPPLPFSLSSQVLDPGFWRPVALIVLTGVASFVLGQGLSGQNPNRRPLPNSLPSAVNEIGQPFVTEPVAGQPRHRLSFDSRRQVWLLDTDRDNDGKYDIRQTFRASGAAW